MKADIPLAERRRLEREQQAQIRAMLAPRHFATMSDQMAIDAALFLLELESLKRAAPVINAMLARLLPEAVAMPAPVVTTPLESAAAPLPLANRSGPPDMPFDLRSQLGLR